VKVAELWRYPVKSLGGESLVQATISAAGIEGDRLVHVEDQAGRVITARTHPRLLGSHAALGPDGEPWVDGRPWNAPGVADEVRAAAGPGARLVRNIPGDVFDLSGHTLALRGNFLFNERISFLGGYSLRIGEVASTTQQNLPIFLASTAVSADPAFGKGFFAYRIDAFAHTLTVGLSVAIGEHSSANVEYSHVIGDARGDITYHDNIVRVGFLYRY